MQQNPQRRRLAASTGLRSASDEWPSESRRQPGPFVRICFDLRRGIQEKSPERTGNMRSWRRRSQVGGLSNHSAIADSLEIPFPFTIEKLCQGIAEKRGRRIHIHAIEHEGAANSAPCGAWIALESSDHIFVESATSPLHRDHIILHELCHMLLGHSCLPTETHVQPPAQTGPRRTVGEVLSV